MTDRATVAKLRDLASDALAQGRLEQALKCLLELERIDRDPDWSRRAAGVYKRMGRTADEIEALSRASREYVRRNEILKAVATSKQILALDPRHAETLRRLPELRAAWDKASTRTLQDFSFTRPSPASSGGEEMEIERTSDRRATRAHERAEAYAPPPQMPPPRAATEPGGRYGGIASMPLRDVVPGARLAANRGSGPSSGIYQIPLDDEVGDDVALELDDPVDAPLHVAARGGAVSIDQRGNVASAPDDAAEDALIAAVEEEVRAAEKASSALAKAPLFAELPPKTFGELLLHARLVELEAKKELFKQGSPGDALYVIAEGEVGVVDEGPPRRGIAKLKEGDYFGEIALVTDQPRTATIVALTDAMLIGIDREVIHKVIATDPKFLTAVLRLLRNRLVDRLLSTNPLFTALSPRDRESLKPRFRFLELDAGAVVITEGQRPEGLLILLAGGAEAFHAREGSEVILGELFIGDVCGETSLLSGGTSLASVRTKAKSLAIELPAAAFHKIVSARPEAMAFVRAVMEQRVAKSKSILAGQSAYGEGHLEVL